MENLIIEATEDTPQIVFDLSSKQFIIQGRSLPEDVTTFYTPVLSWLEEFGGAPVPEAVFRFKLEYFNTASSKLLLDILMKLEEIKSGGDSDISIEWHYLDGDSDMQEAGEEFKELIEVPFNFVQY